MEYFTTSGVFDSDGVFSASAGSEAAWSIME
jgi:hypothetical protein